jgi:hypothetical protein
MAFARHIPNPDTLFMVTVLLLPRTHLSSTLRFLTPPHLISHRLLLLRPSQVYSPYTFDAETTLSTVKISPIGRHVSWASTSFSDYRTGSSCAQSGPRTARRARTASCALLPRYRPDRLARARCACLALVHDDPHAGVRATNGRPE